MVPVANSKNEYQFTKMPWGKYKGRYLSELPDSYIKWCILNWSDKATVVMFIAEAQRRKLV
jgi:uncharacterized protein (DUF3820 family)